MCKLVSYALRSWEEPYQIYYKMFRVRTLNEVFNG